MGQPSGIVGIGGAGGDRQRRFPIGVERAKALAAGLRSRRSGPDAPAPLAEATYLLEQCQDSARPLIERVRILGLMATSLDLFFVEQLPTWWEWQPEGTTKVQRLPGLPAAIEPLLRQASRCLESQLLPDLYRERGIRLRQPDSLSTEERAWLRRYFRAQVYPLLTPLAVDPAHPFPFISSNSLNVLVHLRDDGANATWRSLSYARIKVPRLLPRFVALHALHPAVGQESVQGFLWSEDLVRFFLPELFPGLVVEHAYLFRVLRAAPRRRETDALVVQSRLARTRQMASPVVRLDVEAGMPSHLIDWLIEHLEASPDVCYRCTGPLAQYQLIDLANLAENPY